MVKVDARIGKFMKSLECPARGLRLYSISNGALTSFLVLFLIKTLSHSGNDSASPTVNSQ